MPCIFVLHMCNNNFDRFLNAASFLLGYENLMENREQSRQNDIQGANDRQARYLIGELNAKFEEQNELLRQILDKLDRLDGGKSD